MLLCPYRLTFSWAFSKGQSLITNLNLLIAARVTAIVTYLMQVQHDINLKFVCLERKRSVKSLKKAIRITKKKHTEMEMVTKPVSYCRII